MPKPQKTKLPGANFGHALSKIGDLNGDGVPDLMTGANQQNEGWGYILYLNSDKTVKTFTRINNTDGGFDLALSNEARFSRSISFIGDLRGDGTIAVNYGGRAGAGSTGTLYLLFFKPCDFNQESGYNHWTGGNILYSNWTHSTQTVSDSLTFEQCTFKAFETDAAYMTYNFNDGRCICKDSTATLTVSTELSTAFSNQCYSGLLSTDLIELNADNEIIIYPNPTNNFLTLKVDQTSFSERDRLQLFSVIGEQLYSSNINSQQTTVDLSKIPEGTYILITSIDGIQKSFKILKE